MPPELTKAKSLILAKKAYLIDVRREDEWQQIHLAHARLFPLDRIERGLRPDLPKDAVIYVHCRTGNRSKTATALLQQAGFKNAINLPYTVEELKDLGF